MDKKAAAHQLLEMRESAKVAGILDKMFLGFGTCLGIVRDGGFIDHDRDMDVCFHADEITRAQQDVYHKEMERRGLFEKRDRQAFRLDNDKYVWMSCQETKVKCCSWFWTNWNNYAWHTKGQMWVKTEKFRDDIVEYSTSDQALMKGIPLAYVEKLTPVNFLGKEFQIPAKYGSCLDWWYPNWFFPKEGGASKIEAVGRVIKWKDKHSWRLILLKA